MKTCRRKLRKMRILADDCVKKTAFLPKTGKAVGIDVGMTHLAVLSAGRKFDRFSSDFCEK